MESQYDRKWDRMIITHEKGGNPKPYDLPQPKDKTKKKSKKSN